MSMIHVIRFRRPVYLCPPGSGEFNVRRDAVFSSNDGDGSLVFSVGHVALVDDDLKDKFDAAGISYDLDVSMDEEEFWKHIDDERTKRILREAGV